MVCEPTSVIEIAQRLDLPFSKFRKIAQGIAIVLGNLRCYLTMTSHLTDLRVFLCCDTTLHNRSVQAMLRAEQKCVTKYDTRKGHYVASGC